LRKSFGQNGDKKERPEGFQNERQKRRCAEVTKCDGGMAVSVDSGISLNSQEVEKLDKLIEDALTTDGAHHKQWYLEQIAFALSIPTDDYEFQPGIAP